LQKLASGLNIPEIKWKDKRKLMVLRSVRHFVEKTIEEKDYLKEKSDALDKILNVIEEIHEKKVEEQKKKTQSTRKRETPRSESKHEQTFTEEDVNSDNSGVKEDKVLSKLNVLKKDFILSGKIGEPTHEKDIGYLGVVRQMADGRTRILRVRSGSCCPQGHCAKKLEKLP